MKKQKNIGRYLSEQFIGSFTGFVTAMWATSFVSRFFATRSIHNLWGLASKKKIIDRQTFQMLEWIASVIIGYLVFEIVFRLIKNKLGPGISLLRIRYFRFLLRTGLYIRIRNTKNRSTLVQEMP